MTGWRTQETLLPAKCTNTIKISANKGFSVRKYVQLIHFEPNNVFCVRRLCRIDPHGNNPFPSSGL